MVDPKKIVKYVDNYPEELNDLAEALFGGMKVSDIFEEVDNPNADELFAVVSELALNLPAEKVMENKELVFDNIRPRIGKEKISKMAEKLYHGILAKRVRPSDLLGYLGDNLDVYHPNQRFLIGLLSSMENIRVLDLLNFLEDNEKAYDANPGFWNDLLKEVVSRPHGIMHLIEDIYSFDGYLSNIPGEFISLMPSSASGSDCVDNLDFIFAYIRRGHITFVEALVKKMINIDPRVSSLKLGVLLKNLNDEDADVREICEGMVKAIKGKLKVKQQSGQEV